MSLCLSSFWVVWLHRHKFSPPPFISAVFLWHAHGANPPLSTCSCTLFANFPSSFSHSSPTWVIPLPLYPCCFYPFGNDLSLQLPTIFFSLSSPLHLFLFIVSQHSFFPSVILFLCFSISPLPLLLPLIDGD